MEGFEPPTHALQKRRSTTELHRQKTAGLELRYWLFAIFYSLLPFRAPQPLDALEFLLGRFIGRVKLQHLPETRPGVRIALLCHVDIAKRTI